MTTSSTSPSSPSSLPSLASPSSHPFSPLTTAWNPATSLANTRKCLQRTKPSIHDQDEDYGALEYELEMAGVSKNQVKRGVKAARKLNADTSAPPTLLDPSLSQVRPPTCKGVLIWVSSVRRKHDHHSRFRAISPLVTSCIVCCAIYYPPFNHNADTANHRTNNISTALAFQLKCVHFATCSGCVAEADLLGVPTVRKARQVRIPGNL